MLWVPARTMREGQVRTTSKVRSGSAAVPAVAYNEPTAAAPSSSVRPSDSSRVSKHSSSHLSTDAN